jgi:hypothetical protein
MDNNAEVEFKKWLDKNNIPYWYIDQTIESFSPSLRKFMSKRPDFMILLPNFGLIFVDIKDKSQADKYDKFFLFAEEVDNYVGMQRIFNIPIWFVISHEKYHYKTWFWIPVSDVTRAGFVFDAKDDKGRFYSVPISEFVQVSENDSLNRIFSKLFGY